MEGDLVFAAKRTGDREACATRRRRIIKGPRPNIHTPDSVTSGRNGSLSRSSMKAHWPIEGRWQVDADQQSRLSAL